MSQSITKPASKKRYDIVGLESPVIDCVLKLDHRPRPNERQPVLDSTWQGGGKVSTGLVAAARLGARTAIVGTIGDDLYGKAVCAEFRREGIDCDRLLIRPNTQTSMSVILSDEETRGRNILFTRDVRLNMTAEEFDPSIIDDCDYFYFAHFDPAMLKGARYAAKHGVTVFMDSDNLREGEEVLPNLHLTDYYIASEELYHHLFGVPSDESAIRETCIRLQQVNHGVVIFTFGAKGLIGADSEGVFKIPAYEVEVVDTTGAGDVFHGAYLAALVRGKDGREAAAYASAAAAVKCTCIGGRAGIPDARQLDAFIRTGEVDREAQRLQLERYRRGINAIADL